jgi:hypothetical protein
MMKEMTTQSMPIFQPCNSDQSRAMQIAAASRKTRSKDINRNAHLGEKNEKSVSEIRLFL